MVHFAPSMPDLKRARIRRGSAKWAKDTATKEIACDIHS